MFYHVVMTDQNSGEKAFSGFFENDLEAKAWAEKLPSCFSWIVETLDTKINDDVQVELFNEDAVSIGRTSFNIARQLCGLDPLTAVNELSRLQNNTKLQLSDRIKGSDGRHFYLKIVQLVD